MTYNLINPFQIFKSSNHNLHMNPSKSFAISFPPSGRKVSYHPSYPVCIAASPPSFLPGLDVEFPNASKRLVRSWLICDISGIETDGAGIVDPLGSSSHPVPV